VDWKVKRPLFPSRSDSPEAQRLLNAVSELMGLTLTPASVPLKPISVPTGTAAQLQFGGINRVVPPYGGKLVLPGIRPQTVNIPLYVAKVVGSGLVDTIAIGAGLTGVAPLVNGSSSGISRSAAGLQILLQDGVNWWAT
jgi:hypothetical protein